MAGPALNTSPGFIQFILNLGSRHCIIPRLQFRGVEPFAQGHRACKSGVRVGRSGGLPAGLIPVAPVSDSPERERLNVER